MSQFSYCFCLSLFHSLWQCALLLVFYSAIQPVIRKQLPSFKRNVLYGLLLTQVIISCLTFFIYYSGSLDLYKDLIATNFSGLVLQQPLIEKIAPWIIALYTSVIFFKSMLIVYNWYRFRKVCKSTFIKPSIDLKLFTFKKANEFGITRKVTLWFSNAVSTPLTFGFLKPVILMPVALLNHLSIADAESLIIHELTHIKNNDYLLNWLLVITETLFFYNPFVKIIARKIKLEREKNCDVQVLQFQYPVIGYAETLLKTAKFKTNINFFPLAAVFKNKQLLQRIHFFTSDQNLVFSKKKYRAVSLPAIITVLLINLFILTQIKNYNREKDITLSAIPQITQPNAVGRDGIPAASISGIISDVASIPKKIMNEQVLAMKERLKEINESSRAIEAEAANIAMENLEVAYAMPVINEQTEEKEVIVKEEASGTEEAVTKAYKVKLKDGKWKDELVYILKERKPIIVTDSICYLKDSVIRYVPAMQ
ncbi:MAG: M56 family metallopeptidase [Ferruginibacter sp.]